MSESCVDFIFGTLRARDWYVRTELEKVVWRRNRSSLQVGELRTKIRFK